MLRWLSVPSGSVVIAAVAIAAAIVGTFAYNHARFHDDALRRAERDTRNVATLLAEHAGRSFEIAEEMLAAAARLHSEAAAGAAPPDRAAIHSRLKSIRGDSPLVLGVGWFDSAGNLAATSRFLDPPPVNASEEEHFRVQRDPATRGFHVAVPIRSQIDGRWLILASMPILDAGGGLAGVAALSIDPMYLARVYQGVELGPSQRMALYRGDGAYLALAPHDDGAMGKFAAAGAIFGERLKAAASGTFRDRGGPDGGERIVSYVRAANGHFVVSAGISTEDALSDFWHAFTPAALRVAGSLVVLAGGAWLLIAQSRRRERTDRMFRGLLEFAPDAMVIVDGRGLVSVVNAQTEALFGYRRSELIGQPVEMLIPEDRHAPHLAHRAAYMAAPRARPMGSGMVLHGRRKGGSVFPIAVSLAPLQTEQGLFVSSAIRDMTEATRREAELAAATATARLALAETEKARTEAEAASNAKTEFLSRMSHELRTPLNAVIGFAQMLQMNRERTLTPTQQEYARHINSGGQHLLVLVDDVLDLAGIEAGRLRLSLERVAVAGMLTLAQRTMEPIAAPARVAVAVAETAGVPDIHADEQRLRQVLLNLVSNAIKYNRPGGSVTLSAMEVAGGRVRIQVADTGIGIPPERHKDIFEPFNRLGAEYTAVDGAGIGLALSKRLIEAMRGAIGFTSQTGSGSVFWVELPVESAAATPARGAAQSAHETARAAAGGYSLLYVEDNPTSLQLMEHLISTLPNVAMLSAPTPQLGIDLAVAHRPDVIVLDLNLPGMSGFDVLARLKTIPETRDIPVVALTAAAMPKDIKRGLAAGFFRYITKPLDVNLFLATIDTALAATPGRRKANGC